MRRGEKVGKYRLTRGPVEGGRGAVWFAVDTELGRPVVLKRALLEDNSQAGFDQLLAEARALAKFSHPHVVTLYDAVRAGKGKKATFWLVMEHVTGGSLDVPVKMAPQLAAHIGAQIAAALAALHAKGIVHCDVKPGNIVITHDRVAKLADFGAAYRADGSETITPNGPISLTPAYAAPEAFRAAPERASDVFSLGATLHWLVTGTAPLRGHGRAVRLEAVGPQVGPLGGVLTAMLQRDPRARPTAVESLTALAGIAGSPDQLPTLPLTSVTKPYTDTVAGVEDPPGGQPRRTTTLVRRRPLLTAGVAAGTALAIAVPFLVMSLGDEADADKPTPSAGGSTRSGAAGFIGDPRTADPCALLDATVFGRYDEAELDGDEGNFNRCDVILKEGGEDVVDVRVELDADPLPEGVASKTTGRVTVMERAAGAKECVRHMAVTGARGNSLRVTAAAREPNEIKEPLCRTADVATGIAVKVLNDGEIPRRTAAFRSKSLAHQDACSLLDAKALEKVRGIDAKDPDVGFGRWDCQWKSTTNDLEVDLRFDQGGMSNDKNARLADLGDRKAIVLEGYEGAGSCRVEVVYRGYIGVDREEGTERLVLDIKGAGRKGRPCELAKELAGSAAAALPSG
ncbi:serine/threonine-protein kinase [Streptomyces sp. NBS 14/10]|uniref:serine/threonine-protein kinase n=1 Tax=Streptomyces sp. NBS 14/10 TaxID=1945643 RepID=UPI000B7CEBB4|nr:serine/threonine-protein kinase [Streptomyces sp. NBS 14/10]KAK1184222.1 serine/threonine-protein kinase [Streptomyces sp. NBS 14/10]NUP41365.1 serine/threonine protein kinase [Streptomyces sp.]